MVSEKLFATSPFEIFRKPLTLQRLSGGTYVNGIWTNQTATTSTFTASVQPLSGEELQSLPEERRNKKTYKLYTSTKLETVNSQNPDRVIIYTETYEVFRVDIWQNNIINHYEIYVSKIDA